MTSALKKTILITGADGQLGCEFRAIENSFPEYRFLFTGRSSLPITEAGEVKKYFENYKIDFCINCAAYTAVDKAEQERELAEKVNITAVGHLAKACRDHNAQFIHISTDYVFDGEGTEPYLTYDQTNPVNYYGYTKLEGEKKAHELNDRSIIIRTAWVYSSYGTNFLKTMLRLMSVKESIGVVNDQHGSPTYAGDLAEAIMQIISGNNFVPGIYHYTNEGVTTWYNFAKEIAGIIKTKCIVNPITTEHFPTPAARPAYSVLETEKIKTTFNIHIHPWQESLRKCMSRITAE